MINKIKNSSLLLYALSMIIIFIIVLFAYWPGILVSDSMVQWDQTQTGIITNWHPAYNTIYLMLLTKICNSPSFILIIQIIIMSFSISYFLTNLEKYYHVNKKYLFICSIILALIPLNYNSAVIFLKDTLYSIFLILLSGLTIKMLNDPAFFKKWWNYLFVFIISLLITLFRHNGIYVIILFSVILMIYYKKNLWFNITLISVIFMYVLLNTVGFNVFNITEENYANKYAPVSHLFARMLNTNEVEFTSEELDELNNYVDVDNLKKTFNVYDMDYSIATEKMDALKNNGKDYILLCIKKIEEYPLVFIKQYLIIDSYLYNPIPLKNQLVVNMFTETDLWVYKDKYPDLNENSKIPFLLPTLKFCTKAFQYKFIGYLTVRPALYLYFSIIALIYLCKWNKNKQIFLIGILPMLNLISLAPAMPVAMVRYVYSTILMGYLLFIWFMYELYIRRKNQKSMG